MKSDEIYFAFVNMAAKVDSPSFCEVLGGRVRVVSRPIYPTIIRVKHAFDGERVLRGMMVKDLLHKMNYDTKFPLETGKLFVNIESLKSLNEVTQNDKKHISKRKIKKIGKIMMEEYKSAKKNSTIKH